MSQRQQWRVGRTEDVELGVAECVPDPSRPYGWTLLVDGVAQSYVDLDDSTHLEFDYVRRIASVINTMAPSGQPLRVLHVGGGGMTLPRYVEATRPGSSQQVVERDSLLAALVTQVLPLPSDTTIDVVIADAREAVPAYGEAMFDLVIADIYRGATMEPWSGTGTFLTEIIRILHPCGVYVVNITDMPPLTFSRRQVVALREIFGEVCVVGEIGMLRGRRFGNVVLAATRQHGVLPLPRLMASVARDRNRGRIIYGQELDAFIGGVRPAGLFKT